MRAKSIIDDKPVLGGLYVLPIPKETFDKINKYAIDRNMKFTEFLYRAVEAYIKQESKNEPK